MEMDGILLTTTENGPSATVTRMMLIPIVLLLESPVTETIQLLIFVLLTLEDLEMDVSLLTLSLLSSVLLLPLEMSMSLFTLAKPLFRTGFLLLLEFLFQCFFLLSHTSFPGIWHLTITMMMRRVRVEERNITLEKLSSIRLLRLSSSFLVWFPTLLPTFVSGLCLLRIPSSQLFSGRRLCFPPLTSTFSLLSLDLVYSLEPLLEFY
mmetsp:Transcript_4608/g.6983  ORF Transcript_4608/g.6983 Transcript_4608/m.6983 type:complete len:207 (-) Transcript_4608:222-842(-)